MEYHGPVSVLSRRVACGRLVRARSRWRGVYADADKRSSSCRAGVVGTLMRSRNVCWADKYTVKVLSSSRR